MHESLQQLTKIRDALTPNTKQPTYDVSHITEAVKPSHTAGIFKDIHSLKNLFGEQKQQPSTNFFFGHGPEVAVPAAPIKEKTGRDRVISIGGQGVRKAGLGGRRF